MFVFLRKNTKMYNPKGHTYFTVHNTIPDYNMDYYGLYHTMRLRAR